MIRKSALHADGAPAPAGAYSQAVMVGDFLFTSGFGPHDPVTGGVPSSVRDQTIATLRNIEAVLDERGLGLGDCVKVTVHLADLADFGEFDHAFAEVVPAPFPARTTVGSQLAGILVEIDVVVDARRDG